MKKSFNLKWATLFKVSSRQTFRIMKLTNLIFFVTILNIFGSKTYSQNARLDPDQERKISGKVTDKSGDPIPGATVVIKDTPVGISTDPGGNFSLVVPPEGKVVAFSFVGMVTQELLIGDQEVFNVVLEESALALDEVIVIGYGTIKKKDLTGSVIRADIESFRDQPNVSILQSLHGSVAGLNVGQVNEAGQAPAISIRGKTSISGLGDPLIVVDGIIFRGSIMDLNPNDIETMDILKDASSTAVYGSQASNGVILITTAKSGGFEGKPTIGFSSRYAFQKPHKYFKYPDADYYIRKTEMADFYQSRTPESGYIESNPNYNITSIFNTYDEAWAYNEGIETNWYDLTTRSDMHTQNHNLSISNKTKFNSYYVSVGYTDQKGYMLNEDYNRINARINIDNTITDWLKVGVQTFLTASDYSGATFSTRFRYEHNPFVPLYNADGDYVQIPGGQFVNPLIQAEADDLDKRLNLFGNIYASLNIPFITGLTYKINFSNNHIGSSNYRFAPYGANFRGEGYKQEDKNYEWSADNILNYKRTFNDIHNIDATFVYGMEKRNFSGTYAEASEFVNSVLGYNRLQAGTAEMQSVSSSAWNESSLYSMARVFYGFNDKYLLTGTLRRDGFSGFGENNKFGLFPSVAFAWVASNESFINNSVDWLNNLKLRISYGSNGNRTISRYQTLARISGGFNYITAEEKSVYTQSISSLASPNLKWETTTGVNLGLDFGILNTRLSGSVDYYNNNTINLLYNVDIPAISRFETFPDNLGKLHNHGLEITLSSLNMDKKDFKWTSSVNFSRNRNELKELLGFDNDNDGKEDDLVSEGLFIGEPLSAIHTYQITGEFWQFNDDIPDGFDVGSYKIRDMNNDGVITPDDRSIIGYTDPSYRFSINNEFNYKNWTLRLFINSVQGGKDFYYASDDLQSWSAYAGSWIRRNFPEEIVFWTPENPVNATYHRLGAAQSFSMERWVQRSFVRLQDISISYNLPSDLLKRLKVQKLNVFMSGQNLATWTKWPGWDPETGENISLDGRPVMESYTIGINVEF